MTAASSAARLTRVNAPAVATWVLGCLQSEDTWMANLEQASPLVLQDSIIVFELLLEP